VYRLAGPRRREGGYGRRAGAAVAAGSGRSALAAVGKTESVRRARRRACRRRRRF